MYTERETEESNTFKGDPYIFHMKSKNNQIDEIEKNLQSIKNVEEKLEYIKKVLVQDYQEDRFCIEPPNKEDNKNHLKTWFQRLYTAK